MRLAAFLLALPLFGQSIPFPGPGTVHTAGSTPITLLTHACGFSLDTNVAVAGPIDTSGATLLVVTISDYTAASVSAVPSDSKMNTWTSLTTHAGASNAKNTISYAANPTVGSGHIFTATGSVAYPSICVAAFSGTATVSPFDLESGAGTSGGGTTLQPGSITPSQNNEVVIGSLGWSASGTVSVNGGFTITDQTDYMPGAAFGAALAYLVQTTATGSNPTWTFPSSEAGVSQASFKAP